MRAIREGFWLLCMDVLATSGAWRTDPHSLRWRLYGWCVERAADAHWEQYPPALTDATEVDEEGPF